MRAWLLDVLNKAYVKLVFRWGIRAILFLLATMILAGISIQIVTPRLLNKVREQQKAVVILDDQGNRIQLYKNSALPKTYDGELEATSEVLIYENQLRSVPDLAAQNGQPAERAHGQALEDGTGRPPGVDPGPQARRQLISLFTEFLLRWESFTPSTDPRDYRDLLEPFVLREKLDAVASRKDNRQNESIRPGGPVGSRFVTDGFVPSGTMIVQRYDGRTAYLTALGEMITSGPSLVLNGKRYIRSYALVVEKTPQGWKVARAVAQTYREVIE